MGAKCVDVGDANPDIAGIGIILSFSIQAGIAIVTSFYSFYLEWRVGPRSKSEGVAPYQEQLKIANEILLQGGDVQVMTGISLLLAAISQIDSLQLYHLHIVYDTVSFVGISLCASIACSFSPDMDGKYIRYTLIAIWALLYLAYASLFGTQLQSWNYDKTGHCYITSRIATADASHPYFDTIYLSITCLYVNIALIFAFSVTSNQPKIMSQLLCMYLAALQFPLHVYSVSALRKSNEPVLNSGSSEQQWGFGQVVAMILLANNVIVLLNGIQERRVKLMNPPPLSPRFQPYQQCRLFIIITKETSDELFASMLYVK
ncbi:uncharacterized protein LY89DRAFT_722739 [Mollisia scopiformis]|uniref:Uncharacterized protein n=1 Tax=Mollisia scopiformis TaxID=149040 RepID=A0A194WVK9_MOLSC|nr:uncharacterized protein LY89DRAFT_722739 [Mollisia scopiformis]KUJ11627.1 hypothetical protein LY89DRAFT_722739 [Mollisia scopiformis]